MENKKSLIKTLFIRLGLIFTCIVFMFFLITFPIDIKSNFSIYFNRKQYKIGKMIVKDINTEAYESPHLFADGFVNSIKTSVYLGLERDVTIKDNYLILFKPDGKDSFLITKNFKFFPYKYLIYGVVEIISIPFFILFYFKTYKYFKHEKINL